MSLIPIGTKNEPNDDVQGNKGTQLLNFLETYESLDLDLIQSSNSKFIVSNSFIFLKFSFYFINEWFFSICTASIHTSNGP